MDDGHDLVVRTIQQHASALLRTARRHSICADDAHDAYQRALEIFLKRASTLDPKTVDRWLHVVVKHEAMAVRKARLETVGTEEAALDVVAEGSGEEAEDRVLRWDRLARSAEALQRLKPQELTALWLKASGLSYAEIAERQGWTYTKVNRCVSEGRRAFMERYAGIEAGEECERWASVVAALVDGEATAEQVAAARPHLRRCPACRATVRELRLVGPRLAGVLPLLPVVATGGATGRFDALRVLESAWGSLQERAAQVTAKVQGGVEVVPGARDRAGLLVAKVQGGVEVVSGARDRAGLLVAKVQGGVEVVSGAKLAAVASAAVVAGGGGALAVHEAQTKPPGRPVASKAPAQTPRPSATTVALVTPARVRPATTQSSAPARATRKTTTTPRKHPAAEFPRTRAHEFSPTGNSRSTREFRAPAQESQTLAATTAAEPVATTARHEFPVPNAPTAGTSSPAPPASVGARAVEHRSVGEFGGR